MSSVDREASHLREQEIENQEKTRDGVITSVNPYSAYYFLHKRAEDRLDTLQNTGKIADKMGLQKPHFDSTLIDLAETKKKEIELYNFESWIEKVYDQTDPAQNEILTKIYPAFKTKREQYIIEKYDLAKWYELLKLFGLRDQDDLILMYMVANGAVDIPSMPFGPTKYDADAQLDKIMRGIFNPYKWTAQKGSKASEIKMSKYKPASILGENTDAVDTGLLFMQPNPADDTFSTLVSRKYSG